LSTVHYAMSEGYTVGEVDTILGPSMGRPKSAVFRTCDLSGLDTTVHVADNLYQNAADDPQRETFRIPEVMREMIHRGWLGEKSGQGFYKRVKGPEGESIILELNLDTLEYQPQQKVRYPSLGAARNIDDPLKRMLTVLEGDDRAGQLARQTTADSLIYAAERAVIASRFGGSADAYHAALAQAGATVAIARGILSDELRRAQIAKTLQVRPPSASEIATFYESYPDVLVRPVTANPAPAWLGWQKRGLALDSIAPDSIFKLRSGTTATVLTVGGTFHVRPVGAARPLGTMPLSAVTPTIRAALTSFARGAAFDDRTVAQASAALATTICADDDLPTTGAVELESFLPFLAATG